MKECPGGTVTQPVTTIRPERLPRPGCGPAPLCEQGVRGRDVQCGLVTEEGASTAGQCPRDPRRRGEGGGTGILLPRPPCSRSQENGTGSHTAMPWPLQGTEGGLGVPVYPAAHPVFCPPGPWSPPCADSCCSPLCVREHPSAQGYGAFTGNYAAPSAQGGHTDKGTLIRQLSHARAHTACQRTVGRGSNVGEGQGAERWAAAGACGRRGVPDPEGQSGGPSSFWP